MFDNIGFGEILVIGLFILIFFGPKKIPDIARTLGKAVREFRKAMQDVQSEIQSVTGIDLNSEVDQIKEIVSESTEPKLDSSELNNLKFLKGDEVGLSRKRTSPDRKSSIRGKRKASRTISKVKSKRR